ncbi:D-amino acid oxidase [Ascobolus immersus RN42]|uniref:D-amino acid oxidase n=1 Tax=Ascobolus immersus RN42 TaxID=1160509 RepID=A0A3N4I6C8_ASCIM|nr:D-amino acid oxidase [Ascobolus immersus RN42]
MTPRPTIVVLGAGVCGLTSALLLARQNKYNIYILAQTFPGDLNPDPYYTSPIAGANSLPVSSSGTPAARWDEVTFKELWKLKDTVPEAGIHEQTTYVMDRGIDGNGVIGKWWGELLTDKPWFADVYPDFKLLKTPEDVGPAMSAMGATSGKQFKSVCINVSLYLPYLVSECLKLGVQLRRGFCTHISDVAAQAAVKPDLVVNCTGLRARFLGGVEDEKMVPVRGQIAVVKNVSRGMVNLSGTDDGPEEVLYIMNRPAAGGTILGGSYQKGNWDTTVDPQMAQRILKRCLQAAPEMVKPGQGVEGLEVIRHVVGLRPLREGGVRVEREEIGGVKVVHNYGAGGFGYQASYGLAEDVVGLVEESFGVKAKL